MTNIRPLGDKLVIKVIDETEQTSGGIFIPDSAREKPQKGEVVAVGPGKKGKDGESQELEVKVGDVVLYEKFRGTDIKIDGQELKIITEENILGVIED